MILKRFMNKSLEYGFLGGAVVGLLACAPVIIGVSMDISPLKLIGVIWFLIMFAMASHSFWKYVVLRG